MTGDAALADVASDIHRAARTGHILHIPRIPRAVWVIALTAVLLRAGIALSTHFTNEDFLITLRYADNIAQGKGFVYNEGERVLGTTTPLYTLLLAAAEVADIPPVGFGKAINILADGALCIVVFLWMRQLGRESAGIAAAFLVAVSPLHLRWSISGMETSLVTLCGTVVWLLYLRRQYLGAFGVLGVLFLLRWDSSLLLLVLTAAVWWRERTCPLKGLALFSLIVIPWLLFATEYFGSPIPVTGMAKMTVYGWRYRFEWLPLWPKLRFRLVGTPVYAILTCFALNGARVATRDRLGGLLPMVAWFLLYWAGFLLSKILLFEWYLPPTLPVYEALIALGIHDAFAHIARRGPARIWAAGAILGGAAVVAYVGWLMNAVSRETQQIEDNLRLPLGRWLARESAPSDRIFLEPIGYIGYYSKRRIVDAIGLVTPSTLRYYRAGSKSPWLDAIEAEQPEWCVLRPGELQHILDASGGPDSMWLRQYERVRGVSYSPRVGRDPETFFIYRRRK